MHPDKQAHSRPSEQLDPRRWRALAVCLVAGFLTLLDVSIVNVALPSIEVGLEAGPTQLQWILTGYALSFGLVLISAGRLATPAAGGAPSSSGCASSRWPPR